jgi:hypothetical protein
MHNQMIVDIPYNQSSLLVLCASANYAAHPIKRNIAASLEGMGL